MNSSTATPTATLVEFGRDFLTTRFDDRDQLPHTRGPQNHEKPWTVFIARENQVFDGL